MDANDYLNRLVNDLEIVIEAKKQTREYHKLLTETVLQQADYHPVELFISTDIYFFPHNLLKLADLIDPKNELLSFDRTVKIDISEFYIQINQKKENLIAVFNTIINKENLKYFDGKKLVPLSSLLNSRLDEIHIESERIRNNLPHIKDKYI